MELIHTITGRLACVAVFRDTAPDLILHHQHADFLELLAELLDVVADETVLHIHVGTVIEEVQRAGDIDFKSGCHVLGLLFLLGEKSLIEILQDRHVLGPWILEILLIDLVHAAVDDRFFHRLQALLAADDELAQ